MHHIRTLLLIVLLNPCLTQEQPHPQLGFLNQLLSSLDNRQTVNTIYMLRHHGSDNCLVEDWKPQDMSMIRSTQMATFELRKSLNIYRTMALVCISQDSDLSLLSHLARHFNLKRYVRIILWVQGKVSKELIDEICRMAEELLFFQMLVLETIHSGNATVNVYRLQLLPSPRFDLVENLFNFDAIFHDSPEDFGGKEFIVLPRKDSLVEYGYWPNKTIPVIGQRIIIEFAVKKNLSLKFYQGNSHGNSQGHFEMYLSPHLVSAKDFENCANSFSVSSMAVVVPCGQRKSLQDMFKQLNFDNWLLYILPVYATFVVVEWLMHIVINRITGQAHRLGFLNPLVNLRAFAAILGLPFPACRRWTLSLRQLFLALSVFGFVFSNFSACKLSALLTKHPRYAQVQNLEQLRDSGLPVVVDRGDRDYLKKHMDPGYLQTVLPNTVSLDVWQRHKLTLSLNDSFGYLLTKEFFPFLDRYQKNLGRKALCDATNLTIISNLPTMYQLRENSLFKGPLQKFIHRIFESGIKKHWNRNAVYRIRRVLNITIQSVKEEAIPLSFEHLHWLWSLLIIGYGTATLVFLVELLSGGVKNLKRKQQARVRTSEA